ncbi:hypothetical protein ABIE56_000219 [Luteibacter sp. 621]|uniref:hypothetical protein n=1 Tax=Luteibacter sp. 621 TaxID=3373916 RepID=UPI003D24F52B
MSTVLAALANDFFERVNAELKPLGFRGSKSDQAFRIRTKTGTGVAHYAAVRHPGVDFAVQLDFGVRIDAVEALTNDFPASLNPVRRKKVATLGVGYGNLIQGSPISWTIAGAEDVPFAVDEFMSAVVSTGLPFIEKYSDMTEALQAMGGNEPVHWELMPLHDKRASRSLILAYLLRNRAVFDRLAKEHEENLVARNHMGLDDFRALVADLREAWP